MKKSILLIGVVLVAFGLNSFAQSSKQKAEQLAAEFNKEKHKQKEKNGVIMKKDIKVESRPDILTDASGYAATYELEGFGQYLTLDQSSGAWRGVFSESKDGKTNVTANLKDIKIEDALLTATLIDKDGKEKPFEAVFITRSVDGYDAKGIGFKQDLHLANGMSFDKAFFKRKEL